MIVIIRGHLRNSFETKILYYFIEELYNIFPDLKIFIHTWNIFSNNISWRNINTNNTEVTNEIIYNYFDKLSSCIKHIIIDDDKKITLHGNLNGKVGKSLMPLIGWKNYWYGKYKIIDYIYNKFTNHNESVINLRFDLFSNSNNFRKELIIDFIKNKNEKDFKKNKFLYDYEFNGIDNIYIGNINTMHKLIKCFFYNLDNILIYNNDVVNQEKLVYKINSLLFDYKFLYKKKIVFS
jgi:hypothetical protein